MRLNVCQADVGVKAGCLIIAFICGGGKKLVRRRRAVIEEESRTEIEIPQQPSS